jgi:hypothetical protein
VTGPLAQRRQRPRRRISPNANTSTTTMISTHNHVDMAASLVGAGATQIDATAGHPSKQLGHRQATFPSPNRRPCHAPARRTPAPCDLPADLAGWRGWVPARPRPGQAINTATRSPETHELEGNDALRMGRPGRALRWWRQVGRRSSGFNRCDPRRSVDVDGLHRRQVDQHAALGGSIAGQAVTPAADRHLKTGAGGELQRPGYVVSNGRPDDDRRAMIVEAVVAPPRVIVVVVVGEEQFPAGHALVQNLRRGHFELAVEEPVTRRLAVASNELALVI